MKNKKSVELNKGFRNSLFLGIFLILTLVGFISMVGINIHRVIKDRKEESEKIQKEIEDKDTVWITLPQKEIIIKDTVWKIKPSVKVKQEENTLPEDSI